MSIPILFEFAPTRSNRAKWALEELAIPYESQLVDFTTSEQQSIQHKQVHPLGLVPTLQTELFEMHESVAIVLQLLDEYPEQGFAPPLGSPLRPLYYQWCVFAAAELDHHLFDVMKHTMHLGQDERNSAIAERGKQCVNDRCQMLSAALAGRSYLLGDEFSGADIAIGYDVNWLDYVGMLKDHPRLVQYHALLKQRPAFQKVFMPRG